LGAVLVPYINSFKTHSNMSEDTRDDAAPVSTGSAAAGGVDAAKEHAQAAEKEAGAAEGEAKGTQAFEPQSGGGNADGATVDTETGEAAEDTASDQGQDTTNEGGEGDAPGAGAGEGADTADQAGEDDVVLGKYRITGEAPYTDEHGNPQGNLEVGSVQELPVAVGDDFVAKGVAEKVE
jgi:hypothetical protein